MADEDRVRGLSPYDFDRLLRADIIGFGLTPIAKASEQNIAEIANTDILAAALSPTYPPCIFTVMASFSIIGIFKAAITKASDTQTLAFNSGTNLVADALYTFSFLVHSGDTINFQYSVNATLRVLRVQEIAN